MKLAGRSCQGPDPKWERDVSSLAPASGCNAWEPEHRLAFSIQLQTDQIPPATFDEHVRIGGPFFDVLRGECVIEPLPNGETRLHISSQHRVSTHFNWYARFWTDGVMSDVQETILTVIQRRCEAQLHEGTEAIRQTE